MDFAYLQERLDLTAPDLSKQMRTLVEAGYAEANKTRKGPGSSTWYRLTRSGRRAYDTNVSDMQGILDAQSDA
ncbi:MAG TPA: transcriptional regulator [Acidimicrobiia bacterium]|nr:transcriptional regulator [Acidimicrobiia bacterium]